MARGMVSADYPYTFNFISKFPDFLTGHSFTVSFYEFLNETSNAIEDDPSIAEVNFKNNTFHLKKYPYEGDSFYFRHAKCATISVYDNKGEKAFSIKIKFKTNEITKCTFDLIEFDLDSQCTNGPTPIVLGFKAEVEDLEFEVSR